MYNVLFLIFIIQFLVVPSTQGFPSVNHPSDGELLLHDIVLEDKIRGGESRRSTTDEYDNENDDRVDDDTGDDDENDDTVEEDTGDDDENDDRVDDDTYDDDENDDTVDEDTGDDDENDRVDEKDEGILWSNGIIYYKIENSFLPKSRILLSKVMKEFEERTCIRFKRHTNEKHYVVFSSDKNECSSSVGRVGGSQTIHLGKGCLSRGKFEHEIMHSLGFIHEHSRPDRDNYIDINYKNIKKEYVDDFEKYSFDEINYLHEEFNFASIMLYRNKAFSKNGEDTIASIGDPTLKFGQRIQFSIGDVRGINKLYKCQNYLIHPNYNGLVGELHGIKTRKDIEMGDFKGLHQST